MSSAGGSASALWRSWRSQTLTAEAGVSSLEDPNETRFAASGALRARVVSPEQSSAPAREPFGLRRSGGGSVSRSVAAGVLVASLAGEGCGIA